MTLLTANRLTYHLGGIKILDNAQFTLEPKSRVALIGRNGEGKSTLLKILAGQVKPDLGEVVTPRGVDIALLDQTLLAPDDRTVFDVVAQGLAHLGDILTRYHQLISQTETLSSAQLQTLSDLQHEIDRHDGWRYHQKIEAMLTLLQLNPDAPLRTLSGGWRRRVSIAQVLVREPDILLLDEPTNHLDVETIEWLEKRLLNYPKAIVFITHDRAFMQQLATQILELDRGNISHYPDNYALYLERREKRLEDEERQNALFDKKLSDEETWIRQGIKARRTRNEGRVRNLEKLRLERKARREQQKNPQFEIHATDNESRLVIKAHQIAFAYQAEQPIILPFSINLLKGEKIAFIGPNGAGKTTLVQLLMGQLQPTQGTIKRSQNNQAVIFDQQRMQIDLEKTAIENVVEGSDTLEINGKKKHIVSYLNDFLFSPAKARTAAKFFSGGEINRLLLAKIFSKPANLLVLDEPTNDLDIESLEVLESILQQYDGTAIIISHDRAFIDNIATRSVVFEGNGKLTIYAGGYSDYIEQKKATPLPATPAAPRSLQPSAPVATPAPTTKRPGYISKEAKALMQKIERLEAEIETIHQELADPGFYTQAELAKNQTLTRLKERQQQLEAAYEAFMHLE